MKFERSTRFIAANHRMDFPPELTLRRWQARELHHARVRASKKRFGTAVHALAIARELERDHFLERLALLGAIENEFDLVPVGNLRDVIVRLAGVRDGVPMVEVRVGLVPHQLRLVIEGNAGDAPHASAST